MKIPRDISSDELIKLLNNLDYKVSRQIGSHIRLTSKLKGGVHHITIPKKKSLKIGTINSILSNIAEYLKIDKKELLIKLFS